VLNSFARRLVLVAAAGLAISTANAGTPPSLSGAIPGPMGKYAVKDAAGLMTLVGDDVLEHVLRESRAERLRIQQEAQPVAAHLN